MQKKDIHHKPTRKNAIPTPLTRGIGPFYPIRKAQSFEGTIERQQVNGKAESLQSVILLGSPHFRFLLAANNLLFTDHDPTDMWRFETSMYGLCRAMGITPTGRNYKQVQTLIEDWRAVRYYAVIPYRNSLWNFDKIMLINFDSGYMWQPHERIHFIFNKQYLEAMTAMHCVYFNMRFLSQFKDGYSPMIMAYIQGQRNFYDGKVCLLFKEQLEEVLGLPYMGLSKIKLRDARKAIHHSMMVTLRARGYFHDIKDQGHLYAVTAAWGHTAKGSKKRKVPKPQPQVAAAVPTDNLTDAGKTVKDWWEKTGYLEPQGDKEAVYNKVGHWIDKAIEQYGYRIQHNYAIQGARLFMECYRAGIEGKVHPNNPSGVIKSPEEMADMKAEALEQFRHGMLKEAGTLLKEQHYKDTDKVIHIGWINQERFWFTDLYSHLKEIRGL